MIVLTGLSLLIAQWLDKGDLKKGQVINVEYANDAFLPSYLGYTFVALDVPNAQTLYFVYGIIFVFTFLSQALYFNPVFLLYGYRFYNVTTANNVRVFLISKKKIKIPNDVNIESLLVINNFTYLDNEEK
ncbi:MAG TPA: hypothetical protein VHM20_07850 [Gammaproteobacteria bacterium]|jgi:hypothetical protein|nr:hypothetical protein [Gammaproteobacteria bacterium]